MKLPNNPTGLIEWLAIYNDINHINLYDPYIKPGDDFRFSDNIMANVKLRVRDYGRGLAKLGLWVGYIDGVVLVKEQLLPYLNELQRRSLRKVEVLAYREHGME